MDGRDTDRSSPRPGPLAGYGQDNGPPDEVGAGEDQHGGGEHTRRRGTASRSDCAGVLRITAPTVA